MAGRVSKRVVITGPAFRQRLTVWRADPGHLSQKSHSRLGLALHGAGALNGFLPASCWLPLASIRFGKPKWKSVPGPISYLLVGERHSFKTGSVRGIKFLECAWILVFFLFKAWTVFEFDKRTWKSFENANMTIQFQWWNSLPAHAR